MSKLSGRKVKIVGCRKGHYCFCVGRNGVVKEINDSFVYNIEVVVDVGERGTFQAGYSSNQLRYLNNKPVVLP